jgi:hypothetical protein
MRTRLLMLVGLSELKPGAHLGDAPSILKLFDGTPRAAPPGATEWDQAFLKFLYATDPQLRLQKRQIPRDMAREMVHRSRFIQCGAASLASRQWTHANVGLSTSHVYWGH